MNIANEETIEAQMMSLAMEHIDDIGRERTAEFLGCLSRLVAPDEDLPGPIFIKAEEYFSDPSDPTDEEVLDALSNLDDEDARLSLHIVNSSYTEGQVVALRKCIAEFVNVEDVLMVVDAHPGNSVVLHAIDPNKHTPGHSGLAYSYLDETGEIGEG